MGFQVQGFRGKKREGAERRWKMEGRGWMFDARARALPRQEGTGRKERQKFAQENRIFMDSSPKNAEGTVIAL